MKNKLRIHIGVICLILTVSGCTDRTNAVTKLPADIASVGIMVETSQRTIKMGEQIILPIVIRNNGSATIPSEGKPDGSLKVLATYHWFRQDGVAVEVWDGMRTELSEDIGKGDSLSVPLMVQAPSAPGSYILMLDVVQEGAQWFWDTGSQVARMQFTVTN